MKFILDRESTAESTWDHDTWNCEHTNDIRIQQSQQPPSPPPDSQGNIKGDLGIAAYS